MALRASRLVGTASCVGRACVRTARPACRALWARAPQVAVATQTSRFERKRWFARTRSQRAKDRAEGPDEFVSACVDVFRRVMDGVSPMVGHNAGMSLQVVGAAGAELDRSSLDVERWDATSAPPQYLVRSDGNL